MMYKHLLPHALCVLFVLLITQPASAQNERIIIGTAPFLHPATVPLEAASRMQVMVTSALAESNRFNVVEVAQTDAIDAEIYEQGDEKYLDGVVTQVAPLGAEYLLLGTVAGVDMDRSYSASGTETYTARVTYNLRTVSVGTREVICEELIQTGTGSRLKDTGKKVLSDIFGSKTSQTGEETAGAVLRLDTPEASLEAAINDTRSQVDTFIASCFPLTFQILAVEKEGKGGRVEEVLISGGEEWGLSKGDALHVIEQQAFEMPDGSIRHREIPVAALKVKEVQGEGFSVCEVDGRKNQEKLRDTLRDGATLLVTTADD